MDKIQKVQESARNTLHFCDCVDADLYKQKDKITKEFGSDVYDDMKTKLTNGKKELSDMKITEDNAEEMRMRIAEIGNQTCKFMPGILNSHKMDYDHSCFRDSGIADIQLLEKSQAKNIEQLKKTYISLKILIWATIVIVIILTIFILIKLNIINTNMIHKIVN